MVQGPLVVFCLGLLVLPSSLASGEEFGPKHGHKPAEKAKSQMSRAQFLREQVKSKQLLADTSAAATLKAVDSELEGSDEQGGHGLLKGVSRLFRRSRERQFLKKAQEELREREEAKARETAVKAEATGTFKFSDPGQACPKGWIPVNDRDICKQAHEALGGKDQTAWRHEWAFKPQGCFLSMHNGNLNFNMHRSGDLNNDTRSVCENRTLVVNRVLAKRRREKNMTDEEKAWEKQKDEEEERLMRLSNFGQVRSWEIDIANYLDTQNKSNITDAANQTGTGHQVIKHPRRHMIHKSPERLFRQARHQENLREVAIFEKTQLVDQGKLDANDLAAIDR